MRFRPNGGLARSRRGERAAAKARAIAIGDKPPEEDPVFDTSRYAREVQRSENIAAGLPPDTKDTALMPKTEGDDAKSDARKRGLDSPPPKQPEKEFKPVHVPDPKPERLVDAVKVAAKKVIKKVKRIVRPVKREPQRGHHQFRGLGGASCGALGWQTRGIYNRTQRR